MCVRNTSGVKMRQGGSTPNVDHFVDTCAALCGSFTQSFVALEQRSTNVMQAFFVKTRNAGFHVVSQRAYKAT